MVSSCMCKYLGTFSGLTDTAAVIVSTTHSIVAIIANQAVKKEANEKNENAIVTRDSSDDDA